MTDEHEKLCGVLTSSANETSEVLSRFFASDERGTGFRATWRATQGFVNLSIWREDRCVETFHLSPTDARELVRFLIDGLAATSSQVPPERNLHVVGVDESWPPPQGPPCFGN